MFGRSFPIARIAGVLVEVHPSWLLILAFLSWSLSDQFFPDTYEGWSTATYWVVGTSAAVLLFVTVLVHEFAHALVAIRRGLPVPKITLFIFGGVSHLSRQPKSAGEEFAIAAAGPATSFVIAALTGVAGFAVSGTNEQAEAILYYLASVNAVLGVFNLLPGFPLDGGRVLRSIAWRSTGSFRRATRIASSVGELFGYALMGGGFLFALSGFVIQGLWFLFIGWFLTGAARSESQGMQLESILAGLFARDLMDESFPSVAPGLPVQAVVDDYMVGEGHRAVIVANDGTVMGILSVNDVRRVPRAEWPNTPAQRVMTPRERVVSVDAGTPAFDVLMLVSKKGLNQVPVLAEGRMVGLITRRHLLDRIQLAETLAPDVPKDE